MEEYEEMLEKVQEEVPEDVSKSSRFELPKFNSHIQGKKTFIKNFQKVANDLRRDKEHLMKYLTKECGVPAEIENRRLVLKGKFRQNKLNEELKNYVDEYVLCKECGKPDTKITTQKGIRYIRCESCGGRSPLKEIK